jgi:toxin CptA
MRDDTLLIVLTFALGALLAHVSLCALAGMQQLVQRRQAQGLLRLAVTASAAGVVLLVLNRVHPMQVLLPGAEPWHRDLLLGGALLGIGALINGGCYLGSVQYLGTGNLNFLFTLLGIGAGLRLARPDVLLVATHGAMAMGLTWWLGLLGFSALLLLVLLRAARLLWWPLLVGGLAGLIYARHPAWSYGRVIDALAHGAWQRGSWLANLAALSLFAGAVSASVLAGRWRVQAPTLGRGARCLLGGALMGWGAALIPGGNDMLLLWSVPGLAAYGFIAYGCMLLTLAALLALGRFGHANAAR